MPLFVIEKKTDYYCVKQDSLFFVYKKQRGNNCKDEGTKEKRRKKNER